MAERKESLWLFAQALEDVSQEPVVAARSGLPAAQREEAAAAAIVNRWLERGGKDC